MKESWELKWELVGISEGLLSEHISYLVQSLLLHTPSESLSAIFHLQLGKNIVFNNLHNLATPLDRKVVL